MTVSRPCPDEVMTSSISAWGASSSVRLRTSAMPSTPLSGVLISWLMLATNSDLARLASSALSFSARRLSVSASSSAVRARRSVLSVSTMMQPPASRGCTPQVIVRPPKMDRSNANRSPRAMRSRMQDAVSPSGRLALSAKRSI